MSERRTLIFKEWAGTGTGNLKVQIGTYVLEKISNSAGRINKLLVYRKPDQYSSRFAMMANLNKSSHSLSWGFTGMTLTVEKFSDKGNLVSRSALNFIGVAVEKIQANNGEEELTFIFRESSQSAI